jgi:hypothetical protein
MNSFMFNAHQDDPHVAVPVDLSLFTFLYQFYHHLLYLVSVTLRIFHRRPFVMGFAQIVPVHLVHADCEHPFVRFVDSFVDEAFIHQFVHKKGSSMAVVEYQRVSQGLWLAVI